MYKVYLYTSPSGKHYCGITSRTLRERAGTDGIQYRKSPRFYNAIQKYGFENFSVEILYDNLSQEEAFTLERKTIKELNLTDPDFGYNISAGGDGVDSETISEANKKRFQNLEERKKISDSVKNYCSTEQGIEHHRRVAELNKIKFGAQVVSYDLITNKPLNIYPSYREAAFSLSGKRHGSCIKRVVDGERSHYRNLGWRRPTEEDLKFFNLNI